jgi:hypothetical protein
LDILKVEKGPSIHHKAFLKYLPRTFLDKLLHNIMLCVTTKLIIIEQFWCNKGEDDMREKKGISLIALIITIIVIIILAAIVIGVALNTPESANRAKSVYV